MNIAGVNAIRAQIKALWEEISDLGNQEHDQREAAKAAVEYADKLAAQRKLILMHLQELQAAFQETRELALADPTNDPVLLDHDYWTRIPVERIST